MISLIRLFLCTCLLSTLSITAAAQQAPQLPPLNSPPTSISSPGKFIWFDLATPDIANQQAFYKNVFGWSFRSPTRTEDKYSLVINDGKAIAGIFNVEPPGGEQDGATWIALMSVDDLEQTLKIVRANGGTVEQGPVDVAQRGQHALIKDPAGALFGVLSSSSGDPVDQDVPTGGIFWVDLFARDVEKMAAFYSKLAPYTVTEREVIASINGRLLTAQGRPRAGIVPVDEEANRSAWIPYIRVENIEATMEKVVDGGGFAIVAPDKDLLDGNLAVFVDPNGGVTGIVKWTYESRVAQ